MAINKEEDENGKELVPEIFEKMHYGVMRCVWLCRQTLRKKATIHQVTTMLANSKKALFPGPIHLLTTGADDPTLCRMSASDRERPRNRTFSEVASMVVTWSIFFFPSENVIKFQIAFVRRKRSPLGRIANFKFDKNLTVRRNFSADHSSKFHFKKNIKFLMSLCRKGWDRVHNNISLEIFIPKS